ncbi:MAG: hypothetical protein RSG96_03780, partial [Clostridia bacterium]
KDSATTPGSYGVYTYGAGGVTNASQEQSVALNYGLSPAVTSTVAAATAAAGTAEQQMDDKGEQLRKTLRQSGNECASYDASLREVERSLKRGGDESAGLAEKQTLLQRKTEAQGQACDALQAAYADSCRESGAFSDESVALAAKLQDQKDKLYKTQSELNGVTDALKAGGTASSDMASDTDKAATAVQVEGDAASDAEGENSKLKDAMASVGEMASGALKAGLAAAAAAISALSVAALAGAKELIKLGDES